MNVIRKLWWRLRPPVLALGGGGARGFAHLGVLEVLQDLGLPFRAVAGTSMGSVIGGMYLYWGDTAAVRERWESAFASEIVPEVPTVDVGGGSEERADNPLLQMARRFKNRLVISVAVNRSTIAEQDDFVRVLEHLLPEDRRIEDLPRPYVAVATDIETGEEVRLRTGSLRRAIQASSSIPGLVPPVEVDGRLLVDGGVVAEVPVGAAAELGRPVVAVDVSMDLPPYRPDALVLHTTFRTGVMTSRLLRWYQLREADMVIRPQVGVSSWSEWDKREVFIEAGRRAAREVLGLARPAG